MNLSASIELFTMGAVFITSLYHTALFIQQKDKYLLLYAVYLFSVSVFIFFRHTTRFDPMHDQGQLGPYLADEPLQLIMYASYVLFISTALNITYEKGFLNTMVKIFYVYISLLMVFHLYRVISGDRSPMSSQYYLISRTLLSTIAVVGLSGAWKMKKNLFHKLIITGGFAYAIPGILTTNSIAYNQAYFGLSGSSFYYIGCLLDVIIFSSALGYRYHMEAQEKLQVQKQLTIEIEKSKDYLALQNKLLVKENESQQLKETNLKLAIEKQDSIRKERERILADLHDDLGGGISTIRIMSDLLLQEQPQNKKYLGKISNSAADLSLKLRTFFWALNHDNDNLSSFLEYVRQFSINFFNETGIQFHFTSDIDPSQTILLSGEVRKNLFLIIKESYNNSIKYANADKIHLSVNMVPGNCKLDIQISDNGVGLKQENKFGMGLKNIVRRMTDIGGEADFINDNGTRVILQTNILQMA